MAICFTPREENVSSDVFTPYKKSHPLTVEQFESMHQGGYWFQRLLNYEHGSQRKTINKTAKNLFS